MVGDLPIPEYIGVHFTAIAARPKLTLKNGVRARRSVCRKVRFIARPKDGGGVVNLDNVDSLPIINRLLAQHIGRIGRKHAIDGLICHVGHTMRRNGVVCRRGGVVAGNVLFSGCRIVRLIGGVSRSRLLRFGDSLCRRSSVGCRRGRRSRILRNCRRHQSRGNLARRGGGIRAFGRERHARQQQLADHECARTDAGNLHAHATPSTVNQRASALALGLIIKVASVHNGLPNRRINATTKALVPLRWSCTTKVRQMALYA